MDRAAAASRAAAAQGSVCVILGGHCRDKVNLQNKVLPYSTSAHPTIPSRELDDHGARMNNKEHDMSWTLQPWAMFE
ncbi:hypothetical protein SAY87_027559 [Trapa incisa]|uniref:Uncharacterized protein n=1 Tax=Trapa incisa TaxID=236973 RepID=A0AAN7PQL1_9MYRT|nr:hypothetical protein SAY87_027559 [Trapa incisa]